MTPREIEICRALESVSFFPGTRKKSFAKQMIEHMRRQPDEPISAKQSDYLEKLVFVYRRQLPAALVKPVLVERAKVPMAEFIIEFRENIEMNGGEFKKTRSGKRRGAGR